MQFGLFQSVQLPEPNAQVKYYKEALEQVRVAEQLGFDSVWFTEHHFSRHGIVPASLTVLAYLAGVTTTMRLGTAVAVLPFHNPIKLAEEAATVDLLSDGRLDLGVGRGYQWGEYHKFAVPMDEATRRFEESMAILTKAWTATEPFDYHGEFWSCNDMTLHPRPVQLPHPPIWVAASSATSMDRVARHDWNLLIGQGESFTQVASQVEYFRHAVTQAGGTYHPGRVTAARAMYTARTEEQARQDTEAPFMSTTPANRWEAIERELVAGADASQQPELLRDATRNLRRIDWRPIFDIERGIEIRIGRIATLLTGKARLTRSIGLRNMPTSTTAFAGIARVHQDHRHACQLRLVLDKTPELRKAPPTHLGPLRLPELSPCADMRQIFQRQPASGACSLRNECFTDAVIHVPAKPCFSHGGTLQRPPDVLGTHAVHLGGMRGTLEPLTASRIAGTAGCNPLSAVRVPVRRCDQIDHAEIDTEKVAHGYACAIRHIHGHQQKPFPVPTQDKIGLPMREAKALRLVGAHEVRHHHTACQRLDAHPVWPFEAQVFAHRERHSGMRTKCRSKRLVSFVRFHDLRNTPYRGVRWQAKPRAQLIVCQLLQRYLIGTLVSERHTSQPRCCLIEAFNDRSQGIGLGVIGKELELQGQFHAYKYIGAMRQCQMATVLPARIEPMRLNLSFPSRQLVQSGRSTQKGV